MAQINSFRQAGGAGAGRPSNDPGEIVSFADIAWSVEDIGAAFVILDHTGQKLVYVYFED